MFLKYGFSAKKTNGYGIIRENIAEARGIIGGVEKTLQSGETTLKTFLENVKTEIEELGGEI